LTAELTSYTLSKVEDVNLHRHNGATMYFHSSGEDFMKKQFVVLLALTMFIGLGVSAAFAAPYVSGNVGAVWLEKTDFGDEAEITFDTGFGITAAIGNAFENGLRAEVEFGYRTSDVDDFDSDSGSVSNNGDISTISLMVNGYYDFMPKETICPFIGAGIGYANVEGDIDELGSEDDNVFAYQVAVGVAFAINPQTKIDVQYRYFDTDDGDFDNLEVEYGTHNAMLGVRYSF
jgi:opacity protein-like surface antigen